MGVKLSVKLVKLSDNTFSSTVMMMGGGEEAGDQRCMLTTNITEQFQFGEKSRDETKHLL